MQGYLLARALPAAELEAMIGLLAPTTEAGHVGRT
jgi:hypothetical protein